MFKSKFFLLIFILSIFLIPNEVNATTKITFCDSGCDYNNFEKLESDYYNRVFEDKDLIIEFGNGEYIANKKIENISKEQGKKYGTSGTITIKGNSKENSILNIEMYNMFNNYNITFEDITLNISDENDIGFDNFNNLKINNVIINFNDIIDYSSHLELAAIGNGNSVTISNVIFNNNIKYDEYYIEKRITTYYTAFNIYQVNSVNINNLTINNNSEEKFYKGIVLNNVENGKIDNLTVNNSLIGLFVHRNEDYNKDSNIEVNNSNLLNNTCSSFNILDKRKESLGVTLNNNINNKNYQVIFNKGNSLNCAVASGNSTNTFVSENNNWEKDPTSYNYNEINYDNLTNTVQNVNNGTVDVVRSYKKVITIEEGSSKDIINVFNNITIPSDVIWTSEDDSIARVENGKILGLKEGQTKLTGISSNGLTTYIIEVTVIKNPTTNSMIYIGIGVILILALSSTLYLVYRKLN